MRYTNSKHLAVVCYLASLTCHSSAAQLLLPTDSEGCPYVPEPCTAVALVPEARNDSCHQQESDDLARQITAADAVNVSCIHCHA